MPKSKSKRKKPKKPQRAAKSSAQAIESPPVEVLPVSTNGYHLAPPSPEIEGITERMEGVFQVASVLPFFICAWIRAGWEVKDVLLFSLFFGSIVVGSLARSMRVNRASIPFPEQFLMLLAAAVVLFSLWAYSETENVLVFELLAGAGALRLLLNAVEVERPRTVILVVLAQILSLALIAPLGAYLGSKEVYLPFALFGVVPGMVLSSALVVKYSPLLERSGWKRSISVERKGVEQRAPGSVTRLFSLLLVTGPVIPGLLVPFNLVPNSFAITVLSLYRVPTIAEGFLNRSTPENRLYWQLVLVAIASEALMLGAALIS